MIVLYLSCSLVSQTIKCSTAICLETSDLKIILLQAVVVYGDATPEFVWRNSGKQKETLYIRRCQAEILTRDLGFSLNVFVISHCCKKYLLEDCEILYFGSKKCNLVRSAGHRLHRPAPRANVDSIKDVCAAGHGVCARPDEFISTK
jgi:hypothetical protein